MLRPANTTHDHQVCPYLMYIQDEKVDLMPLPNASVLSERELRRREREVGVMADLLWFAAKAGNFIEEMILAGLLVLVVVVYLAMIIMPIGTVLGLF